MNTIRMAVGLIVLCLFALLAGCDLFTTTEHRIQQAREHMENADYRAAAIELRNVLKDEPANETAHLLLAESAWWLGDARGAESELKKLVGDIHDPAQRDELDLRVQISLGRPDVVLDKLDAGSAATPARQHLYRGQAHLALGQFEAARTSFAEASSADPALADAYMGTIETLTAEGRGEDALRESTALVARITDSALAWYMHGVLLIRDGQMEAAGEAFQRASELAPRQLDLPRQAAVMAAAVELHFARGEIDAAREAIDRLAKLVSESPLSRLYAGRLALVDRRYADAVNVLRDLVTRAPAFTQAKLLLATAFGIQGNIEQATQQLNEILVANPEQLDARQMLAQLRLQRNDPSGAMDALIPVLPNNLGNPVVSNLVNAAQMRAAAAGTDLAGPRVQFEKMLARSSGNPQTIGAAALFFARSGDLERSRQLLDQAIREKPSPPLLLAKAEVEWNARAPAAAKEALNRLLGMDPSNREAHLALAGIDAALGDRSDARTRLESLRARDPHDVQARLQLARIALADRDMARVDTLVEEAVRSGTAQDSIRSAAGSLYLSAGQYAKAAAQFQAAAEVAPRNLSLWLSLGRAQAALRDFATAEKSLQKALELEPNWVPAIEVLTTQDLMQQRQSQALDRVAALRRALPDSIAALGLEGNVNMAVRRYAEAADAYAKAYRLEPTGPLAVNAYRARTAGGLERPEEFLNEWLTRNPGDFTTRAMLAESLSRAGRQNEAAREYERVLSDAPNNVLALNNLAWLYYELGDARAVGLARRAQKAAPDDPALLDTLGWILVESGQVVEGLPMLRRAAGQSNPNPEIRYHYAAALARAGRVREAEDELISVLAGQQQFGSRKQAEELLRRLQAGAGASGPAAKITSRFQFALGDWPHNPARLALPGVRIRHEALEISFR